VQTLIAVVGVLVTVLVLIGMVLMVPRNLEEVVRTDADAVGVPVDTPR